MHHRGWMATALVGLAALAAAGTAAPPKHDPLKLDKSLKETLEQLLPRLGAEQGFEDAQRQWQEICFALSAPGREEQRAEAARLMADKLGTTLTPRGRVWLLTQLMRLGRAECVEAVAKAVDDSDVRVRDAALRALAAIPVSEAGQALQKKLASTTDSALKVGVANALGYRAEPGSVAALARQLSDADTRAAAAAAMALGKVATPEAARALAAGAAKAPAEVRERIADSRLRCADALLRAGKAEEARAQYTALAAESAPRGVRLAALTGLLRASDDPATLILRVLASDDAGAREVVCGYVVDLKTESIRKVADKLADLPQASQLAMLAALAARRDQAALPGVLALTRNGDEPVRIAAVRALGGLGDGSTVALLLETMAKGGDLGNAARDSLQTMWDKNVDPALIDRIRATKDAGQKHTCLDILQHRRAEAAVPLLVELTATEDAGIRRKAVAGLGLLAGTDQLITLLRMVPRTKDRGEQDEIERAIVEVCARIPDQGQKAEPVLAFYTSANDADKAALLPLLGRFGGDKPRQLLRAGLTKGSPEWTDGALRGLCNWPDNTVLGDLASVAKATTDERQRQTAIRGFIRLLSLRDDHAADPKAALERLGQFKEVVPLATRKEDRAHLLERAGMIRHLETARFLLPYLDNADTAQAACRGLLGVAHSDNVRRRDRAEFDKVLDRVIQVANDRGMKEEAQRYKERR